MPSESTPSSPEAVSSPGICPLSRCYRCQDNYSDGGAWTACLKLAVFTNAHIQGDVFHPVEEENGDPTVGVSPHELYAAESRRIFTPLFPECNPFNVRNNRDTFLEVGEKLWLRQVYGVLMAFSLGNRALAIFCFLLGISHWYNSPLKCVCQGVFLKVMSGESILRPDSKLFCCFLIKTIKYCVCLDVFAVEC